MCSFSPQDASSAIQKMVLRHEFSIREMMAIVMSENSSKNQWILEIPGLVNSSITMERSTIFHGNIHYFDWAIFNSFLCVYQRVRSTVFLGLTNSTPRCVLTPVSPFRGAGPCCQCDG